MSDRLAVATRKGLFWVVGGDDVARHLFNRCFTHRAWDLTMEKSEKRAASRTRKITSMVARTHLWPLKSCMQIFDRASVSLGSSKLSLYVSTSSMKSHGVGIVRLTRHGALCGTQQRLVFLGGGPARAPRRKSAGLAIFMCSRLRFTGELRVMIS